MPDAEIPESFRQIQAAVEKGAGPHVLTGPIFVQGAEAGDSLEVHLIKYEFPFPFGSAGVVGGCNALPGEGTPNDNSFGLTT
jgi:acetamidase/formamidase